MSTLMVRQITMLMMTMVMNMTATVTKSQRRSTSCEATESSLRRAYLRER